MRMHKYPVLEQFKILIASTPLKYLKIYDNGLVIFKIRLCFYNNYIWDLKTLINKIIFVLLNPVGS